MTPIDPILPKRCWGIVVLLLALVTLSAGACTAGKAGATEPATQLPWPTSTPIPTVIDPGLAYGVPCRPPCWYGLVPGKTTREEAAQILGQLRASGKVDDVIAYDTSFDVYLTKSGLGAQVHISLQDGILESIDGDIGFDYEVGDLIEQFGSPEGVYRLPSDRGFSTCSSCDGWEPPTEHVIPEPGVGLLYPSQGLYFIVPRPPSGSGCICPRMGVDRFCYFTPQSMKVLLSRSEAFCGGLVVEGLTEQSLIKWNGFGGGY